MIKLSDGDNKERKILKLEMQKSIAIKEYSLSHACLKKYRQTSEENKQVFEFYSFWSLIL